MVGSSPCSKGLAGNTKGYKNHPKLIRFKNTKNPLGAIAEYLRCVVDEADKRGYKFDRTKICDKKLKEQIHVSSGQIEYEFTHLSRRLKQRTSGLYINSKNVKKNQASSNV